MTIRQGVSEDLANVTSLLREARLPAADLGDSHMVNFLVAVDDESPVGIIGL
jgi:hypothetical protein